MGTFNFHKEKIKTFCLAVFLCSILFSGTVLGADFEVKLTDEYKKWNELTIEEKEKTLMPQTNFSEVTENVLREYEVKKVPNILNELLGVSSRRLSNVSATNYPTYNLANKINMRVEHQGKTTECWAFSVIKSMETNIALLSGETELKDFSERHADYATSRTFLDGINENGFYRETGKGGLPINALTYLTNGQGAVLEKDMPFVDDEGKISLSEIDKKVDTIVTDYTILPSIRKTYTKDSSGNTTSVTYYDAFGKQYSNKELENVRNMIKEHLIEKGAITTMTGGNFAQYYNRPDEPFLSTAYNCNDSSKVRDHAITIVGWDDNYSRDNFAEGTKPSSDGAYIILNSYGEESFNNGYMYISYEDTFIESEMYGICSTSSVDYNKIYQHDYYGGIFPVGTNSTDVGYYGVTYKREDESRTEFLNQVGISLDSYANVEVFVNPTGTSMNSENLIKVGASNETLSPGYHRINITPIELTGSEFAIVVKQTSNDGKFYFQIEANVEGTAYALVESDNRSFISTDGYTWSNLATLNVRGFDMSKADVCIKAFTTDGKAIEKPDEKPSDTNKPLTSTKYRIDSEYIMNIPENTKANVLLENLSTDLIKVVLNEDETENTNSNTVIKTGMKLKLSDGKIYTLIVRGDIKPDGIVDLTDLSKLILHYNENKGFELSGNPLKAADMNLDGKIDLTDISQLLVLYNSK